MPNEPENTSVSAKPCPIRYQSSNATTPVERNSNNQVVTPSNIIDDALNPTRAIMLNAEVQQNASLDTMGELPGYLLEDLRPLLRSTLDPSVDNWFIMSSIFNSLSPQSTLFAARVRVPSIHNQVLIDSSQATFGSESERNEWISLHTFCIVEDQAMLETSNARVAGTVCKVIFQDPNGEYAVITHLSDGSPNPLPDVSEFTSAREYDIAYGETVRTLADIQAEEYTDYLEEECRNTEGTIISADDQPVSELYHSMDDFFPGISTLPLLDNYTVTSPSCRRALSNGDFHAGFDLATPVGTPLVSPAPGVVKVAIPTEQVPGEGTGKMISIYHERPNDQGRELYTRFLHLNTVTVRPGQRIQVGQQIGTTGNTGRSTGPHLHYEMRIGGLYGYGGTIIPAFRSEVEPIITAPFIV